MSDTITLKYENDDGDEIELEFPSKMEVCPACEGHGTQLHSALRGAAYTMEEFVEAYPEDEDREAYFRRGSHYDVTCETCHGENVIPVVDESKLSDAQKAQLQECEDYEDSIAQADMDIAAEMAAERRAGC